MSIHEERIKRLADSYNTSPEIIETIEWITKTEFSDDPGKNPSLADNFWQEKENDENHQKMIDYLDKYFPDWEVNELWWGIEKFKR